MSCGKRPIVIRCSPFIGRHRVYLVTGFHLAASVFQLFLYLLRNHAVKLDLSLGVTKNITYNQRLGLVKLSLLSHTIFLDYTI